MYESIYKNNEVENEVSLDMSYVWYSDVGHNKYIYGKTKEVQQEKKNQ
jgi:hypothetical protein